MDTRYFILIAIVGICLGCAPVGGPAVERFYVAPVKLELHEQLGLQSKVSGIALHGDRVELLERRRKFARVRLQASGAMGWVDGTDLLTDQQWAKLERIGAQAAAMPVQASAQPFDELNVHTDPNRQAPSFYVVAPNSPVEIVGHIVTPRVDHDPRYAAGYDPAVVPAGAPVDDWLLVRAGAEVPAANNEDAKSVSTAQQHAAAGWVLSRLMFIRLPDAVTQQARGAPIMAAIPLGSALDEDGERHSHWLMATVASRNQAYEFDTLRVLAWNVNRHRYDITHQQKDLVGYYPIELEPVPGAPANALAGFSLLVQTGELERERRHYAFPKSSTRPKMMSAETITLAKPEPARREDYVAPLPLAPPAPAEPPYWQRVRTRWKRAWS